MGVSPPQLSAGTGPGGRPQTPGDSGRNFQGCLENLVYNGHNLIQLVRLESRQVSVVVSGPVRVWTGTTGAEASHWSRWTSSWALDQPVKLTGADVISNLSFHLGDL